MHYSLLLQFLYIISDSAIILFVAGIASCVLVEYLIQRFCFKGKSTIGDCSAIVTGILLALNLPPASPWWIIVIGSIVAIGVAKMTFGGLGQNIFNPALVGRVFLLVSFPVIMTDWTAPASFFGASLDASTGATPLALVKEALANGQTVSQIFADNPSLSYSQLLFARVGSAGEISAIALLLGFVYLLARRVIKPHINLGYSLCLFWNSVAVQPRPVYRPGIQSAYRRYAARLYLHGYRLRDFAYDCQGYGYLWCGYRSNNNPYP